MERVLRAGLFLVLPFLLGAHAMETCPAKCSCSTINASVLVQCNSTNVLKTAGKIPDHSTHVLIYQVLTDHRGYYDLDFTTLTSLEVLMLDQEHAFAGHTYNMANAAFPPLPLITKFASRLRSLIDPGTFSSFHLVEDISLSGTETEWDLVPDLMNRSLCDKKYLKRISLHRFSIQLTISDHQKLFDPRVVFNHCEMASVEILDISGNGIFNIKRGFLAVFPNLKILDISSNRLTSSDFFNTYGIDMILEASLDLQLHTFLSGHQPARTFQEQNFTANDLLDKVQAPKPALQCNRTLNHYTLMKIVLNKNYSLLSDLCISIEVLSLNSYESSSKHIVRATEVPLSSFPRNVLKYVDVSNIDFSHQHESTVYSFLRSSAWQTLEYLNLQAVKGTFFNASLFSSAPSLKTLLLGGNEIGHSFVSMDTPPFSSNLALEVLDLAGCELTSFPRDLIAGNTRLLQLNLTNNFIKHLDLSLGNLLSITLINISNNLVQNLSQSMRDELDALTSHLETPPTFDMTGNDLDCGCHSLDFVTWMQNTKINVYGLDDMICSHPYYGHVTLKNINVDELRSQCYPSVVKTVLTSVMVTFSLMVILIVVGLVYCWRWKLRFWWYVTQKGWKDLVSQQDLTQYEYDAFVAYDHRDINWVKRHLLVQMEEERHFRFCVHHRDFPGGQVLEEVIADSIQKSRKTILVLTPEFVESRWCQFELSMARNQLFDEGRDVIVAVLLKPLQANTINNTLYNVLRKKLYLEWVENDLDAQELFWRKLKDSLV